MPTSMVVVTGIAQAVVSGVKVNWMLPLKPDGSKVLLKTPVPDQSPFMPLCELGNWNGSAISQMEAGTPSMVGSILGVTVMDSVVLLAHSPAFGVKVSATGPLKPFGSKKLLLTPGPDQVPSIPDWLVGKFTGASSSQRVGGTPVIFGVIGGVTSISAVVEVAQKLAFGVNVSVTVPLWPDGSNRLPLTPGPDQLPRKPLWLVGNITALSNSQSDAGTPVMVGSVGGCTSISVVAGLAQSPVFGVKVNVTSPLKLDGSKLLPLTPWPDQVPAKPPCVVGKLMFAPVSQMEAGTPVILGVVGALMAISSVAGLAHWPASGVNVKVTLPL